ncbi:MAG: ABC transporter ATP-binding protein [Bryobacteraceae bacterium]
MTAVEVRNLSKNYPLSGSQLTRLRHVFAPGKAHFDEGLWALRDVTFSVERGEAFGIIGANGSGKSTLLQRIAGILRPTSGSVQVEGRLSALLELGSGFSPEFTGRDNVYLNASLLGLSRSEVDARFDRIERFAEIGAFIDQPIKTYSTGMVLRLAFAVVAHVDPDILIVDEALAVGDISFRQRCMRKIHDLRSHGATLLFVSHETSDVKALCERCLWLQNGVVQELGAADDVVAKYLNATLQREIKQRETSRGQVPGAKRTDAVPKNTSEPDANFATPFGAGFQGRRFGDGRATILDGVLTGASGQPVRQLTPLEPVVVRIRFRANAPVDSAIAGFLFRSGKGENIFGSNNARENYPLPPMQAGEISTVDFHWETPDLAPGAYSISLGIADGDLEQNAMCDYIEDAIAVTVGAESGVRGARGYFQLRCSAISIHRVATQ